MRSRNYCFTINNYSTEDLEHLACNVSDICNYLICGFEVGEKGTPHIQGYCNLKNPMSFTSFKKVLPTAHIEAMKGTHQEASEYCMKDGDYYEVGKLPSQGSASWDNIELAMANPRENPHMYNQYRKMYEDIRRTEMANNRPRGRVKYIWDINNLPYDTCTIDAYRGEEYVYCDPFMMNQYLTTLRLYKASKKVSIKHGYEIWPFVPKVVYVQTTDAEQDGEDVVL